MSGPHPAPNQQVVPRPVRPLDERAFVSRGPIDDGPAEGLYAARCRGRDLRALARGGRLRPRRCRLDRRPVAAAVHDHPAAAEHHRLAPPRARPADRGRGPDDPPRPDARPPGALPARASTTPRSPPSSCSTASSPRKGRAARRSAASATSSGCARSWPRPARSCSPSSAGSAASADWGRLRYTMDEGSAKAVRVAFERLYQADLAYRTEALVNWCPGCRTSVSDLEVIATPETGTLWSVRYHLIDPATGRAVAGRDHHDRHDPPGDDPRRHRGGGPPGRPALPVARRAPGAHPVRRSRRPDHRRRRRRPCLRDRRGQDHPGPRPRRPRDRPAPRSPRTDHPGRRRDDHRHRDALRRARPVRCARRHRGRPRGGRRPRGRRAARDGHRALPAQQRHHRAAAQDAVVHPDDAARGAGARGDPQRTDPDPPRAIREDLGALADRHPRLERLAPAVVGSPHPRLVLPGWPRDGVVRRGRSGRLRRLRPARRRAPAGPRHLRHLVQLGAVAVLDPGLAGRHARSTGPTTRRRSWRPATTSSSSGSPG